MINIERNKSLTYFLPVFDKIVPIKYFHLLKNSYFWYDDVGQEVFCLLYKFNGKVTGELSGREGFTIYEQKLRENVNYLGECDYDDHVIYMFKLPEELIELKYTLLKGKYSEISEDFKKYIIQFIFQHYGAFDASVIKQVLYKDNEFRGQLAEQLGAIIPPTAELSSIIDIEKEMFSNYVVVKQYKNNEDESKTKKSGDWNPWSVSTDKR